MMQQNTDEWLRWRQEGIGASEVPVILGFEKYQTLYQLWEEKTGRVIREDKSSFVADLGHRWEPVARADFELQYNIEMIPTCVEHKDFPFLRASLDGYNEELGLIHEIKYVGADRLQWVKDNSKELPDHFGQVSQQFIVTGATEGYYSCYTLDKSRKFLDEIVHIEIYPDQERIENEVLPAIFKFWECVKNDTPPNYSAKDLRRIKKESKA